MKTYRVGLLVDGYEQPGWMHELVEWLAHSQDFQIAALLVAGRAGAETKAHFGARAFRRAVPFRVPAAWKQAARAAGLPRPARAPARSRY